MRQARLDGAYLPGSGSRGGRPDLRYPTQLTANTLKVDPHSTVTDKSVRGSTFRVFAKWRAYGGYLTGTPLFTSAQPEPLGNQARALSWR